MRLVMPSIATASQKPCGYEAPELKAANHRLDGAFWPRSAEMGTAEQPVVLLEVQMHGKGGCRHLFGAQSICFVQLHPRPRRWYFIDRDKPCSAHWRLTIKVVVVDQLAWSTGITPSPPW